MKSRKRFGRQRGSGFVNLQSLSGFKFQFLSVLISQIPVEAEAYVLGFYPILCLFCSSDQNIQPWPVVGISFTELCHTSSMSFWSIASPTGTSTSYNLTKSKLHLWPQGSFYSRLARSKEAKVALKLTIFFFFFQLWRNISCAAALDA